MWPPPYDYCTAARAWGRAAITSFLAFLLAGGAGVGATWPDVVPLGKPIQIREPV